MIPRRHRSPAFSKGEKAKKPFFAYVPLTQVHYPTLPHPEFKGRTGLGDFADAMVELDFRVGEIIDGVQRAGVLDETIVIFASDNGPEFRRPYREPLGVGAGVPGRR